MTSTEKQSSVSDVTSLNEDLSSLKLTENVSLPTAAETLNDSPKQIKKRLSSSNDSNEEDSNVAKRICKSSEFEQSNSNSQCMTEDEKNGDVHIHTMRERIIRIEKKIRKITEMRQVFLERRKTRKRFGNPRFVIRELTLPQRYKELLESFKVLDDVVFDNYSRDITCFFRYIKANVDHRTRRRFTVHHLGQIVTVNPEAYKLRLEKKYFGSLIGYEHSLTIIPNIPTVKGENNEDVKGEISPSVLTERTETFKNILLEMAKEHHRKFLSSINVNDWVVKQWHESFPLNCVPEIEPAEIPKSYSDEITVARAVQILSKYLEMKCKQMKEASLDVPMD
ncbi:replication licensing factor Cdt1 [Chamberlinius hualienensis]